MIQTLGLRLLQMCGAVLWAVYGMLIGSAPVIVANVLVLGAAGWSMRRVEGERVRG